MLCSPQSARLASGSTTSGSDESPPSPRSPIVKPRANGTSACWHPSPSCHHASSRRLLMAPPRRISPSPAWPKHSRNGGPSRSRASDSHNKSPGRGIKSTPDVQPCEPVSATYRTGLRHVETEIGKWRTETGARKSPVQDQRARKCRPETRRCQPNPAECRAFSHTRKVHRRDRTVWLPWNALEGFGPLCVNF
jgi:hypothetical protein